MTRAARPEPSVNRLLFIYRLAALLGFALVFVAGSFLLARLQRG
jgi:hypothetical protein